MSAVDSHDEEGHGLTGMIGPTLGQPTLSSVCGYVLSFSRYEAKRVSPYIGVAVRQYWHRGRVAMIELPHGQPTLSSVCGYVRWFARKGRKVAFHLWRDLFLHLGGVHRAFCERKRMPTRQNYFNSILTYF